MNFGGDQKGAYDAMKRPKHANCTHTKLEIIIRGARGGASINIANQLAKRHTIIL